MKRSCLRLSIWYRTWGGHVCKGPLGAEQLEPSETPGNPLCPGDKRVQLWQNILGLPGLPVADQAQLLNVFWVMDLYILSYMREEWILSWVLSEFLRPNASRWKAKSPQGTDSHDGGQPLTVHWVPGTWHQEKFDLVLCIEREPVSLLVLDFEVTKQLVHIEYTLREVIGIWCILRCLGAGTQV